jgi:hypothetical protein
MKDSYKYEPTPSEKKVLAVQLDPTNLNLNIVERCKLAKVSRKTWYDSMAKIEFTTLLNDMCLDQMKGRMSEVLDATINFAVMDSRCGSDRKILLAMGGLYNEKQSLEVSGSLAVQIVDDLDDED